MPFQQLALLFFTALLVGYSGAASPGPVLSMVIAESAKKGFVVGPLVVLGHGLLEVIVVIGLTLGLTQLVNNVGVKAGISFVGGTVLLWMGYSLVRDVVTGRISLDLTAVGKSRFQQGPVALGILTSLSNPYWLIWWATTGALYVTSALQFGVPGLVAFYTGHILADLTWYSAISFFVSAGRRFFTNGVYRSILGFCGLALIILAAYFGYSGITDLIGP